MYDPGTLGYMETCYWMIVSWDNYGEFTEGPVWNFTTVEEPNYPPYVPSNPVPVDGAENVSIDADLSWVGGDPDVGDVVTYDVYFGMTSPPPQVGWNQSGVMYDPGTLGYMETCYWMIVSWDNYGEFTEGPVWNFTTEDKVSNSPDTPVILSGPTAGGLEIDFNFTVVSSDHQGDQIYYMLDFGDGNITDWIGPFDSGLPLIFNHSWNHEGDYAIRVKAKDIHDYESDWSKPHTISIAPQITFSNIQPGYVYLNIFQENNPYAHLNLLDTFGASIMIDRINDHLAVEATVTEAVHFVVFEAVNIIRGDNTSCDDTNVSDGASGVLTISSGLWQLTACAYDENGTLIDCNTIEFFLYISLGSSGKFIGYINTIRQRLLDRILA
jgi:hypothetical protein